MPKKENANVEKDRSHLEEEPVRLGLMDIVAIFIASAQVLFPFLLLLLAGWTFFIWFSTNVWLK